MRYLIVSFALFVCMCVANLVEDPKYLDDLTNHEHAQTHAPHEIRRHFHHLKFQRDLRMQCGYGQCPDDGFFVYYKCCKSRTDQCCWYLRMWVIVVFGVVLLKAFLACFVSFFRCVCC